MRWRNLLVLLAAGCAYGSGLVPGQSTIENVQASMGTPTMVREYSDGTQALWYSKLPYGRQNWAAVVDPNGILVSFDQRLTDANIARLQPGHSTADNVLDFLGPPFRRTPFPFKDGEAWEYQLPTTPERQTLYVEVSPDSTVRKVYRLYDRDMNNRFP
jgi:outer membrane protein assembly factor BamE (lipoprotein component of BamABCDE complex)